MKFIIHVGPPKTGTSAIQHWCNKNSERLIDKKVFYPSHTLDANGVSSGNLLSLYDRDESSGELVYSSNKLNTLIEHAKAVDASVILLSSEFFFKRIFELAEKIPSAVFLAYIRFELEVLESNYNQSVKRHGKKEAFVLPREPKSQTIKHLTRYVQNINKSRFIFRPYSTQLSRGGNLVSDFLSQVCNLSPVGDTEQDERINTRYSLEGVEFKRWFNKFSLGELQNNLDLFLQKEANQSEPYSLISREDFQQLKGHYIEELDRFFEFAEVNDASFFLKECEEKTQSAVKLQHIGITTFSKLVEGFIADRPENAGLLYEFQRNIQNKQLSSIDDLRLSELYRRLPATLKTKMKLGDTAPNIIDSARSFITSPFRRRHEMELSSSEKLAKRFSVLKNASVYPNVKVISHHIPKTAGRSLEASFYRAYGEKKVFSSYQGSGAKELRLGQKVWVPNNTVVVHGHFPFHENQIEQFPNAKHICWVRDPLERLWSHFNHILNYEQPTIHYNNLLKLASHQGIVRKTDLFNLFLDSSQFANVKNVYQTYITERGLSKFDFIGSTHRFSDELHRLSELLNVKLVGNKINKSVSESVYTSPSTDEKALLQDEYDFIGRYL